MFKTINIIRIVSIITAVLVINGCAVNLAEKNYVQGVTQFSQYGQVKGEIDKGTGNIIWRGIKYAKAPVGDLRWRAPQAPDSWSGVKETKDNPPACAQGSNASGEEDCLYLSVYRPSTVDNNLPVYVWIHGGSNKTGSAPDLSLFAKNSNLVVVSIQYRLGPLGFMNHEALKTSDPLESSGNYGILDQIAALKWVQTNIRLFGGDPSNVTVAGESAGAHDILALLTIEQANGLYHKAVYQSGGMENVSLKQAREFSTQFVEKLSLKSTGSALAGDLRALKVNTLLKAMPGKWRFGVVTDGKLIKGNLLCLMKRGKYNKVPIFLGGNRNEYSMWLQWFGGPERKWSKLSRTLRRKRAAKISDILNDDEQKTFAFTSSLTSRLWVAQLVHSVARYMREYQDDVYVYDFQWGGTKGSNVDFVLGASHANELGYFHYGGKWDWMGRGLSLTKDNEAARLALSNAMMTYQAQFAYSGNPNGKADLPKWEVWSNDETGVKTMNLDTSSEPGSAQLNLYMTKREYIQAKLIQEMDDSNDPIAQKFTKMIAKHKLVKLECE
jgi:para-nitrobenzyl esterase